MLPSAPSAAPPVETAPPLPTCLNCGTSLQGPFCAQCGQSAHTHRFTWAHLLHEIPHSVWHVDRGLPHTLKVLFLRPGQTLRRYLAGQRVALFPPLSLLLLLAGMASFLVLALHIQRIDPAAAPATAEAEAVNRVVFKYFSWFTIALLPVYALLSRAVLRRLGFNLAEHLMACALVLGGVLASQVIFLPFMAWAGGTSWLTPVYYAATFAAPLYAWWAFAHFGRGAYSVGGSMWRGFVIALAGFSLGSVLITGLSQALVHLLH